MVDVDQLARVLRSWVRLARSLPASSCPVLPLKGTEGQHIGRVLPGRGVALDCDLKYAGIAKRIPGVFERTWMGRVGELLFDQTGKITTYGQIRRQWQAGLGQSITTLRELSPGTGTVAGQLIDFFTQNTDLVTGATQAFTSIPGGLAYDASTPEVFNFGMRSQISTDLTYLLSFGLNLQLAAGTTPGGYSWIMISDLLVAAGNVPTDTLATTTVNTVALPRYTNGLNVNITGVMTTGDIAGNLTVSLSYTNTAGVAGRTATTVSNNQAGPGQPMPGDRSNNNLMQPFFRLQAGDTGVQSVQSMTMSTADTAGNQLALQLLMPLVVLAGTAQVDDYFEFDWVNRIEGMVLLPVGSSGYPGALTVMGCVAGTITSNQPQLMTFKSVQG